jgi:error-prone DNA polymerase
MRIAFELVARHKDRQLDLASIPAEDPRTYAMIRKADTLGTFQIESRAQMAMLPRMQPRTFYDLVIQVAIVRPGPIQGDMVHPYLRRREGLEEVSYPKPELEAVLHKTLGVPLFQEQAMKLAIVCAGFTPGEADQLRRAMATFKFTGGVSHFRDKLIAGMVANGYEEAFAEATFKQLEGFGSYGFPESHAASFALISYASSWMKCWYPDVFCCALLNAQPMGFYAPAQIVRDAGEHGVEVRAPCVNRSRWDSTLEPIGDEGRHAVRLGLRLAKGLREDEAAKIVLARADQPYTSVEELARRSGASVSALERLADADAFLAGLKLNRRDALWAIKPLRDSALPLFAAADAREGGLSPEVVEPAVQLRPMAEGREVVEDYGHIGLTLRRHPVSFLRDELQGRRIVPCGETERIRDGRRCHVAGLVLVRQKPGSAKGVMFITIEDETGVANLVVWPQLFERQRRLILSAGMISVEGRIQREGGTTHVISYKLHDLSDQLRSVGGRSSLGVHNAVSIPRGRSDGATHGGGPDVRIPRPPKPKEDFNPDLRLGSGIKVPTRDFR